MSNMNELLKLTGKLNLPEDYTNCKENEKISLPEHINDDDDYDVWDSFLINQSHERLVDFMLSQLSRNDAFMASAYRYFEKEEPDALTENEPAADLTPEEDVYEAFNNELEFELSASEPDVPYVISLTEKYIMMADRVKDLKDSLEIYIRIIERLDSIAGRENVFADEEDTELVEEELGYLAAKMKRNTALYPYKLPDGQKEEIKKFLKDRMERCKTTLIRSDYLNDVIGAFDIIQDQPECDLVRRNPLAD